MPPVLQHQVERIHTLPDQVVLLTVLVEHVPVVAPENRVELKRMHEHASRVIAHYGFTEKPDVPEVVGIALPRLGIECSLDEITYFVGHETFLATKARSHGRLARGALRLPLAQRVARLGAPVSAAEAGRRAGLPDRSLNVSATPTVSTARGIFSNRDYDIFLGARFVSSMATQMQSVAVGWQIFSVTHRSLDLGLVGLGAVLPRHRPVARHRAHRRPASIGGASCCSATCSTGSPRSAWWR